MAQCAARNNAEASRIPAPLSWGQWVGLGPGRVTNWKRSYPGTAVVRASQAQILPAGLINVRMNLLLLLLRLWVRQLPLILERGDEAELSADAGGRSRCSLILQVQYLLHQLYLKQMDVLRLKAPRHPAQDVECAPCRCPRVEDDEHGPMLLCWGLGGFQLPKGPAMWPEPL